MGSEMGKSESKASAIGRRALATAAGFATLGVAGLASLNNAGAITISAQTAASAPINHTVAVALVSALFLATAALSWAFMRHLAESSRQNPDTGRRKRS